MGRYITKKEPAKSGMVVQTLDEAEHDHYLDCPDADYRPRLAAFILDVIFITLVVSGIERLLLPAYAYLRAPDLKSWLLFAHATQIALQATAIYFYAIACVIKYGGTPGKLLFELRVVDHKTGRALTTTQTITREFFGRALCILTLGIGFFMILIRQDRRGMHDLLSGSVVKKNEAEK